MTTTTDVTAIPGASVPVGWVEGMWVIDPAHTTRPPADATPTERFIAWTGRQYRADRRPSRTRQAALHQAGRLGRQHGKAAAYWQIGDRSGADAQPFYRDLLRGIGKADQQITGLCGVPT